METDPKNDDKRNPKRALRNIDDTYILDTAAGIYKPKAEETEEERARKQAGTNRRTRFFTDPRTDWRPIIIATFLSLLTVGLLGATVHYARLQWREMHDTAVAAKASAKSAQGAVTLARESTNLEERAWLAITPVKLSFPSYENRGMRDPTPVEVDIKIENTGKTPAEILHGKTRLQIIPADPPKLLQHYKLPSFDYSPLDRGAGNSKTVDTPILPPNASITIALTDNISRGDFLDYWPYKTAIYGELRYCDVFNEQHWINFCLEYRGGTESTPPDLSQFTSCKGVPPRKNGMDTTTVHEECMR